MSIVDFTNPYEEVQIRGRVVERRPDPDLKTMDPISHKYTGPPFPMRNPDGRVALIMEVEKGALHQAPLRAHAEIRKGAALAAPSPSPLHQPL